MSNARGKHKSRGKRRTKKVSKGLRAGARRIRLTAGAKILLGGGALQRKEKAGGFTPDERSDFGKYMQQRQRTILGER